MIICEYCIEAIESRGERLLVGDFYADDDDELICEWCGDECEESELRYVEFR